MSFASTSILTPGLKIQSGNVVFSTPDWLYMGLPDQINFRVAAGGSRPASPTKVVLPPTDLNIGKNQTISSLISIFHASETGLAGDNLSVQGALADGSFVYVTRAGYNRGVRIVSKIQGLGQTTYQIPADFPLDLYEVWVGGTGGTRSASVLINQARGLHFESSEVIPNGSVRLFGRNLQFFQKTATVRFVQRDDATKSLVGSVVSGYGDLEEARLVCPNLVPGKDYDVYYNNGLRTDQGETKVPFYLTCTAAGTNPFAIAPAWGHRYPQTWADNVYNVKTDSRLTTKAVGDGVADDRAAIQAAIDAASAAGGGVVYLPAGTYDCLKVTGTNRLNLKSKVIIKGAGRLNTLLRYGFGSDTGGSMLGIENNGQLMGLLDLKIQNAGPIGQVEYGLYTKGVKYCFFKNVEWDIGLGRRLEMYNMDCHYVEGCKFTQGNVFATKGWSNPLQLDGGRNSWWLNNEVTFMTGAIAFNFTAENSGCRQMLLENNLFQRDARTTWKNRADGGSFGDLVSHIVSMEFSKNITALRNTFNVISPELAVNINDGELFIAEQGANYQPDLDKGSVTSATTMSLTDSSKTWATSFSQPATMTVAIVAGTGLGQHRKIASRTATTLTLTEAWAIVPDSTSKFSLFTWGTEGWLLKDNIGTGNQRGFLLYYNATRDVTIVGNRLTDSGTIDICPKQDFRLDPTTPSNLALATAKGILPCYDIYVGRNVVSDTTGRIGVNIAMHPNQYAVTELFGNMAIGYECRDNVVNALPTNTQAKIDANFPNGYINDLFIQLGGGTATSPNAPAIIGSILQNNVGVNCGMNVNKGAYNTLLSGMEYVNKTSPINENNSYGVGNSVNTVSEVRTTPLPPVPTLVALALYGPASMAEAGSATYRVAGRYSDGRILTEDPATVGFSTTEGTLVAGILNVPNDNIANNNRSVTITATKAGMSTTKTVSVVDRSGIPLTFLLNLSPVEFGKPSGVTTLDTVTNATSGALVDTDGYTSALSAVLVQSAFPGNGGNNQGHIGTEQGFPSLAWQTYATINPGQTLKVKLRGQANDPAAYSVEVFSSRGGATTEVRTTGVVVNGSAKQTIRSTTDDGLGNVVGLLFDNVSFNAAGEINIEGTCEAGPYGYFNVIRLKKK